MTISTLTGSTGLCRCAVCKIDLRGRFVFVDSQTEKLMGYASEEMFGRSILDFLDSNSKKIVEQVLSDRNHYESHYDHSLLTFLTKTSGLKEVDVTISLCFNGGNPVNYQLIMKDQILPSQQSTEVVHGLSTEEFVECCLALQPTDRLMSLPELLCQYSIAEQVAIYLINEDKLDPIAGALADPSESFSFENIPELTELHHSVIQTGDTYVFCDELDIQAARDANIEPLPELVTIASIENQPCLLRFVYSDNMPADIQSLVVLRARLAGQLATQLFNSMSIEPDESDPGIDMKFTVGFLSALGIGALLTDSEGKIVGYNPILIEILDDLSPGETSQDFINRLQGDNNAGWAALIYEQLQDNTTADLRIDLTLPSGEHYLLVIIRFADKAGDQTGCWALVPKPGNTVDHSIISFETTAWSALVDGMKPALDEVVDGADELSRNYFNLSDNQPDTRLDRLKDAVRTIHQMWEDSSLFHTIGESPSTDSVNLNKLIDEAASAVRGEFPDVTIKYEHNELPTIKTSRVRIAAVLRNLMTNCVRHNQNPVVTFRIGATIRNNLCRIVMSDNGIGMPRRQFQRLFDIYLPPVTKGIPRRNGGAGLGLSRLLINNLGGKVRGVSKEGVGTRLSIMLPQSTEGGA